MERCIHNIMESGLIERLEEMNNHNEEYRQAIHRERELFAQFREELTEEQRQKLDECMASASFSSEICEKLAYRQAMRDLVSILFDR